MQAANRKAETLSSRFDLDEQFLATPDAAALKSALIRAHDKRRDEPVIVKYWSKSGSAIDADLREMWRHEMRQLDRVRAYPGADEVIIQSEHGESADAFFLAMPGDFGPLDFVRRHASGSHWLNNLRSLRYRSILWRNMQRLARALGAVHGQGLVHGRLSETCVFTASASEADFRLGGFEWCVRIVEIEKAPVASVARTRGTPIVLSFMDDWRALGRLAADLLGLDRKSLDADDVFFQTGKPVIDLHPAEADLIRTLLQPERNRELDSGGIVNEVDSVLADLGVSALEYTGVYVLALRLGETSKLSAAVRTASDDAFDPDDKQGQTGYIKADLAAEATLVAMPNGAYVLLGDTLAYSIKPFTQTGASATWQIATTDHARQRGEFLLGRNKAVALPAHRIELITFGAAARRLGELRASAMRWDEVFDAPDEADPALGVRRGLLLAQVAEALFRTAANIPVQIAGRPGRGPDGERVVRLSPREDEDRAELAAALRVENPARMMMRLFKDEDANVDAAWDLSESGGLGMPARNSVAATFLRVIQHDDRRSYEFRLDGPIPPSSTLFLRERDEGGTEGAIRRRLRMLAALATQQELSRSLADPRQGLRSYSDPLEEDEAFKELDPSKQEALRSAWSTGPFQCVVGPPGVGKTTLVTEIVRRVLSADPAARLLLTAQAHQALDHLAGSVKTAFEKAGIEDRILLVRSRSDSGAAIPGVQPQDRAAAYLRALGNSPLVRAAPLSFRQSIAAMEAASAERKITRAEADPGRQRHSFEALVLQCANVLFSTANSGDLEQLVDERAQFDWVMIEEAAKATGSELLAPMLLSMRRLLIGDHNQLPPFDTNRLRAFLSDLTNVRTALSKCDALIGATFRDFGLDDLKEAIAVENTLARICQIASGLLLIFEGMVRREDGLDTGGRRRVTTELREQHRMHPVIATLVAECFYPGKDRLITAPKSQEKFAKGKPPFEFAGGVLPASPIVVIDMPYVQKRAGAREALPLYHNPAELEAIKVILSAVRPAHRPDEKAPTFAALSPYKEQVRRMQLAIEDGITGPYNALQGFESPLRSGELTGTVDSFQGSEADLVVISLVRNNDHSGKRAMGFLSERPRMNVLLSRAKWKLIIVTSLDFLRVQSRRYSGTHVSQDGFLSTFITTIENFQREKLSDGTPKAEIIAFETLTGRRP